MYSLFFLGCVSISLLRSLTFFSHLFERLERLFCDKIHALCVYTREKCTFRRFQSRSQFSLSDTNTIIVWSISIAAHEIRERERESEENRLKSITTIYLTQKLCKYTRATHTVITPDRMVKHKHKSNTSPVRVLVVRQKKKKKKTEHRKKLYRSTLSQSIEYFLSTFSHLNLLKQSTSSSSVFSVHCRRIDNKKIYTEEIIFLYTQQ